MLIVIQKTADSYLFTVYRNRENGHVVAIYALGLRLA